MPRRWGSAGGCARYEEIFDTLNAGVALYEGTDAGQDFLLVDLNREGERISRVNRDDAIGNRLSDIFPAAEAMGFSRALSEVSASGAPKSLPPQHYMDSSRDGWYRNHLFRLSDGLIMAVFHDVTDSVLSAQRLQASETRYALLTESLVDGILDWDITQENMYLSPAWKAQLGYRDEELINSFETWKGALHPDHRDTAVSALERFLESRETTFDREFLVRHRDGRNLWIHAHATALRDDQSGKALRLLGIHMDIDQRKRATYDLQERIKELEGLYRIHQLSLNEARLDKLAPAVAGIAARSMQAESKVHVKLSVDDALWEAGSQAQADGAEYAGAIHDGERHRGTLRVRFSQDIPALPEEHTFIDAAAQSIGLWLREDVALRRLKIFEDIVASTQDQVALVDQYLTYRVANESYARLFGLRPGDLIGKQASELIPVKHFAQKLRPRLEAALAGSTQKFEDLRDTPSGPRYLSLLYAPYYENGAIQGVVVSGHDISELQTAQVQLRRAASAFSNSAEAIIMTDVQGQITEVNDAFCDITGYSQEEACGNTISMLSSSRHSDSFYQQIAQCVRREGRWRGEIWQQRKNGETFPSLMTLARVQNDSGVIEGQVGVFADISNIKENQQRLESIAQHDHLTGLPNRLRLMQMLQVSIDQGRREAREFTVMFIDLDHFKDVNDSLGHGAGDDLLRDVARRLTGNLRNTDMLARVGGDEFVLLIRQMSNNMSASLIASKLLEALREPFTIAGSEVSVSASVGIATYPTDGESAEALLSNADAAMYRAKNSGRASWHYYTEEMTVRASRHMFLINGLRHALANSELRMVYQPQFSLANRTINGLETLMRWRHPDGEIGPSEFVPAAEEGGIVRQLDRFSTERVCQQLAAWRAAGLRPVRAAINVSGRSLHQEEFLSHLQSMLERYRLDGDLLELEITETALLEELEDKRDRLELLRRLGVQLSIDDFGTGYSSLTYLKALPVSRIKIDASFVRGLPEDEDDAAITRAIIAMATELGIEVIAEGVETHAQANFLKRQGCTSIQGFLYSKPLEASELQSLLENGS